MLATGDSGSGSAEYSIFEYRYRDASNYKAYGKVLLTGRLTTGTKTAFEKMLEESTYFIPELVGVPPLQDELWRYSNGPNNDDHPWHELVDLRPARDEEVIGMRSCQTLDQLTEKLKLASRDSNEWQ